jgi:SWI/SNF-related matrix-associated actin-dependent regulator of chromatin subfamily A-like protein 1
MTMKEPMYAFQKSAVARIAKGDQVYLGFDPGLGKSRTALEAARYRAAKRILVICHASGLYVWQEQVRLWSNYSCTIVRGPADLVGDGVKVVTYGLLSQAKSPIVEAIVANKAFEMTVLDEAAAVKNPGSNRSRAILGRMLKKLGYVIPLSGTPAPNHAGELYPILAALYPKALVNGGGKQLAQWQFEDRYCNVKLKKFGQARPVRVIEGSKNLPELKSRINGFMLRVRKEMVLKDLPPVRYDVVPIGVDRAIASRLPDIPASVTTDDDVLAYLNGKIGDEHVMRLRRMLGILKSNPSIEYIDDFMQGLDESRKVLVFAHHKEVVASLMHGLANYHPVKIDGGSSSHERAYAVTTFLNDRRCRVFVGNIQAAGLGLTLVGPSCRCSDVIFVEASYAVGDNVQAAARVHRIGQHSAVVARFLTAHHTIDDRIQAILTRKARDFANLFN